MRGKVSGFCRKNTTISSIVAIVTFVIFANLIYLFYTNPNPFLTRSGLTDANVQVIGAINTIDQNDGFTTQALGVASVNQILRGRLPLWNHYEGIGAPLAGDMQPASLFLPFNLLLILPGGLLLFHMSLEIVACIGAYLFFKTLKLSNWVALCGGFLFAVNGTFAWITNAAFNPIAFLPWMLLSVEMIRENAARKLDKKNKLKGYGWAILAISLAFSLYSGFPETAYLNGLLVAAWSIARFINFSSKNYKLLWKPYFKELVIGGTAGVLLALPILYLFYEYMKTSPQVGGHDGLSGSHHLGIYDIPQYIFAYIYGRIFDSQSQLANWGSIGGYLSVLFLPLATIGLMYDKIPKSARILLAVFLVVCIARIFGVPIITELFDKLPLMSVIAVYRYAEPAVAMATITLSVFGLQNLFDKRASRRQLIVAASLYLIVIGVFGYMGLGHLGDFVELDGLHKVLAVISIFLPLGIGVVGISIALIKSMGKYSGQIISSVFFATSIVGLSLILFTIPQLSSPPRKLDYTIDDGAVSFLKQNIEESRFFSIDGIIQPNYGSYYGVASINTNNLPVPRKWDEFVMTKLNTNIPTSILFTGYSMADPNGTTNIEEFIVNLHNYKTVSVKYLVTASNSPNVNDVIFEENNIKKVYEGPIADIYEIAGSASYFSANNCELKSVSRDELASNCSSESELLRNELFFPGWNASIDGKSVDISYGGINNIFQNIKLPAGRSVIKFKYWPMYFTEVIIIFAVTAIMVIVVIIRTSSTNKNTIVHDKGKKGSNKK